LGDKNIADAGIQLSSVNLNKILESSYDAIFMKTLDNEVVLWSDGAERVYGYSRSEIVGKSVSVLFPDDRRDEADQIISEVRAGGAVRMFETVRVAKDGRHLNVLLTVIPLRNDAQEITGALSIARDVSSTVKAEATVKRLEIAMQSDSVILETANRVALDILAHRSGVEALRHIVDAARALVGAKYGALGVAKLTGSGLQEFVTVGLDQEAEAVIGNRPVGHGILGLLLERTEALRIDSIADDPSSGGFPPGHPQMRTFLGVPIMRGESILGSLYLTDKIDGLSFNEADEVAVKALGAYAAVAVHNLHMQAQQQALVRGLIYAQEEERRTVAYDLHDGLTQYIMASHAHLESYRKAKNAGNLAKADKELDQGLLILNKAVVESRRMITGLRSLALDDLGLAGALEQLLDDEKVRSSWSETDLIHNIEGRRFDKTVETAVYRVAQEALTNAHKHAHASRVRLQLLLSPIGHTGNSQLVLEVKDWGKGFNPEETNMGYEHLGLHSMVERVHVMGGIFKLTSIIGEGTTVGAIFPIMDSPFPEKLGDNS
jgi:PAS domain S-box-containing protein